MLHRELPEGASEAPWLIRLTGLQPSTGSPTTRVDAIQLFVGKLAYFFAASNSFLSDVESQGLTLEVALWSAWVPFERAAAGRVATWRVWPMTDLEKGGHPVNRRHCFGDCRVLHPV